MNSIKKLLLNQGKWEKVEGVPPLVLPKSKGKELKDYKIYGNSIQDETNTIVNVGDTTKNLYNFADYSNIQQVDYTTTAKRWGYNLGVLPAGDYAISFELVDDNEIPNSIYVRQKDAEGNLTTVTQLTTTTIRNNPAVFSADGSSEYYILCASNSVGKFDDAVARMSMFKWMQLETGRKYTGYEPYGYKIPVMSTLQSICDLSSDNIGLYPLSESAYRYGFDFGVLPAGDYTLEIDFYGSQVDYLYLRWWYEDGTYSDYKYVTTLTDFTPVTFTADGRSHYYLYFATLLVATLENAKTEWAKVKRAYLHKGTEFQSMLTNVYISEPLRKLGDHVDYIDYENKKIVRNVSNDLTVLATPIVEELDMPSVPTYKGTTIIEVDTTVNASNMEVIYKKG